MFEIDKEKFGRFVAELRKDRGLTQKDVAKALYVSDKAVSKWERGQGMPDITLLVPLADLLGVTVTELLECRRMEVEQPMEPEQVEALLQKTIQLSAEERSPRVAVKRKHILIYGGCALASLLEILALYALGVPLEELTKNLAAIEVLGAVFGAYFWFFVLEKLPPQYDAYRMTTFNDGVFRMNLPGVTFNNRNWPHVVRIGRIWTCASMAGYPLVYFLLSWFSGPLWDLLSPYVALAIGIGGLLIPLAVTAKKYE